MKPTARIFRRSLRLAAAFTLLAGGMPAFAFYDGALQYVYHDSVAITPVPASDGFARSVAVSGDRLAVGEPDTCPASVPGFYCGIVYIYTRVGGQWVLETRLTAPAPQANAYYGAAIALDGDWLIVGAYGESNFGNVHLYQRVAIGSTATWTPVALDTSMLPAGGLGSSVAISGAGVAVAGIPLRSRSGSTIDGAVATFTRNASTGAWSTEVLLEGNDAFGSAVSLYAYRLLGVINGYAVAVGAPNYQSGQGAGYVYTRAPAATSWTFGATYSLDAAGHPNEAFGASVAISGGSIAFGVPYRVVSASQKPGAVYMVHRNTADWTDFTSYEVSAPDVTSGETQHFGIGVALSSNTLFVGAPGYSNVYQFDYVDGLLGKYWAENFDSPFSRLNGGLAGSFGAAVTFDGTTAVFGSPPAVAHNGAAFTYLADIIFTDGFEGN